MEGGVPHHVAYLGHLLGVGIGLLAILRLTRDRRPQGWVSATLGLGCALMAAAAFAASDPRIPFHDFLIAYYPAGQAVMQGPASLAAVTSRGVAGFVNIPLAAYLFAPFGMLPKAPAIALFTITGLGLIAASWRLLVSLARLGRTEAWMFALLFAGSGPLQNSLREGNTSHMVLLAVVGGLALLHAGRPALAGALLAAAAVLKPPLLLFGLFFLLRRDVRGAAGFGAVGIATALGSLAVFGWSQNLAWFESCVLEYSARWLTAFNVQSIPAFIGRLGDGGGGLLDWNGHAPPASQRVAASVMTALLYAAAAASCLRRTLIPGGRGALADRHRLDLQYQLVLCLSVISSPLSWSHYYCWLLLPVAFLLGPAPSPRAARLGWTAIFLLTPLVWPLRLLAPLSNVYGAFAVSHLLFGALLAFGLIAWRLAETAGAPWPVRLGARGPAASAAK